MDDLISRQAVLDRITASINQYGGRYTYDQLNMWGLFTQMVKEFPSAQKTGHWIRKEKVRGGLIGDSDYRYECSECGFSDEHNSSREVPFCWHCGARMEAE